MCIHKQILTRCRMESHREEYTIPKSHALADLLQLGQQLEIVFIHLHVNKLEKNSFGVWFNDDRIFV
jgi:hypothetical protein